MCPKSVLKVSEMRPKRVRSGAADPITESIFGSKPSMWEGAGGVAGGVAGGGERGVPYPYEIRVDFIMKLRDDDFRWPAHV